MNAPVAEAAHPATSSDAVAIDVRGLTKRFGAKTVVSDVDLRVPAGRITGFLGPNGSGKTTTIRMLCGLLTPDAGEGTCLGFDLRGDATAIRREVGYMTQRFSLYEDLTIAENLDFVARMYAVPRRRDAVRDALAQLGLSDRAGQRAGALSGGWKQRLALAACLIHAPRLLLLDEPTAGVDPGARRTFWDELHRLADAGMTVLVSTHYMDEAERCHALVFIAHGHVLAHGTGEEVIASAGLAVHAIDGIAPAHAAAQARAILALPGVQAASPFGASLHVAGPDPERLAASLSAYAAAQGLRTRPIAPGLEDAFIALMTRARASDAPAPARRTPWGTP